MSSNEKPVRVTLAEPCKHCGKGDNRCSRYRDGVVSICYAIGEPGSVEKIDSAGSTYFVHGLQDKVEQVDVGSEANGAAHPKGSPEDLNAVYSAMLRHLTLSEAHKKAMRTRGFREGEAERLEYRTLPGKRDDLLVGLANKFGIKTLLSVPGFFANRRTKLSLSAVPGLLIPARDLDGKIVAMAIRPDDKLDGGNKYIWISSSNKNGPSSGAPVHVPMGLESPADLVIVTEGLLKADLTNGLSGIPTIGNPGVGNWKRSLPILKGLGARVVRIAYDRDWRVKPEVAKNLVNFAKALKVEGFNLEIATWDGEPKGIDDLLASGEVPTIHAGDQAEAIVKEAAGIATNNSGDATPTLADRVQAKTEANGVAGLLRDKGLLEELAKAEDEDPAEFGAIVATLKKIREFGSKEFRIAIKRAKPEGSRHQATHPYYEKDGCIYVGPEKLTNFTAKITREVVRDDGSEEKRVDFQIEGTGPNRRVMVAEVRGEDFEPMKWVVAKFGAMAIIEAGKDTRSHVRAAIQHLSGEVPRQTVFTHTGWRLIGKQWKYLHAGGAIGPDGNDKSIAVELMGNLKGYCLPEPQTGPGLAKAIRASLRILRLSQKSRPASQSLAALAVAIPYRAVIGETTCSIKYTGPSGSLKSSVAALSQQHFGPGMNADNLPVSWEGTGNGFEALLYAAKDTLVAIDDFAPVGSAADVARDHKAADRTIRGAANHQGRMRMKPDGTPRESKPPRGMILSTGEDGFQKRSANARTVPVQFTKDNEAGAGGTVDKALLEECQAEADAGLYASAMAGFIRWLSTRLEQVKEDFPEKVKALRVLTNQQGAHLRTSTAVADLVVGFDVFLDFAVESGAIDEAQKNIAKNLVWDGLMEAAEEAAAENLDEGSPVDRYISLLVSALSSTRAHIVNSKTGDLPPDDLATACGWHEELRYCGGDQGQLPIWVPANGTPKIGWTDGKYVYLDPENAYGVVAEMIGRRNDVSMPSKQQIHQELLSSGKLARTDPRNKTEGRARFTDRVSLEKIQRNVLVIRVEDFWGHRVEPKIAQQQEFEIGESA